MVVALLLRLTGGGLLRCRPPLGCGVIGGVRQVRCEPQRLHSARNVDGDVLVLISRALRHRQALPGFFVQCDVPQQTQRRRLLGIAPLPVRLQLHVSDPTVALHRAVCIYRLAEGRCWER